MLHRSRWVHCYRAMTLNTYKLAPKTHLLAPPGTQILSSLSNATNKDADCDVMVGAVGMGAALRKRDASSVHSVDNAGGTQGTGSAAFPRPLSAEEELEPSLHGQRAGHEVPQPLGHGTMPLEIAGVHSSEKVRVFVDWVIATFGGADSGLEGGVLDIAGGKGEISIVLALAGIRATVVDPRAGGGRLRKSQRKQIRKAGASEWFGRNLSMIREDFTPELFERGDDDGATCRQSSLVLAMHPDEATYAAVDTALTVGKPFAVVPCCVFARQFPYRKTPDGRAVSVTL